MNPENVTIADVDGFATGVILVSENAYVGIEGELKVIDVSACSMPVPASVFSYNGSGINLDILEIGEVVVGESLSATLRPQAGRSGGLWILLLRTSDAAGSFFDLGRFFGLPAAGMSELLVGGDHRELHCAHARRRWHREFPLGARSERQLVPGSCLVRPGNGLRRSPRSESGDTGSRFSSAVGGIAGDH